MRTLARSWPWLLVVLAGCGDGGSETARPSSEAAKDLARLLPPSAQPAQQPPLAPAASPAPPNSAPTATAVPAPAVPVPAVPAPAAPTAVAPTQATPAETEREAARAGVGEKGKSLEFRLGQTAAKAYFQARERIVFEIQIPEAMKLYKATNGYAPRSQEEFERDILQANQITLPRLPPNHRYVYSPEDEDLFVEHPQGQ